jgi:hypothetical protein
MSKKKNVTIIYCLSNILIMNKKSKYTYKFIKVVPDISFLTLYYDRPIFLERSIRYLT